MGSGRRRINYMIEIKSYSYRTGVFYIRGVARGGILPAYFPPNFSAGIDI